MKNLFLNLFLVVMFIGCSSNDYHSVQIEWRNDRTGIYDETGLLKSWSADGPEMLWYYDGLGEGHSSEIGRAHV